MGKGYVQVYTGDGKGKTTAALGLALRAVGAGHRVFMAQFVKGMKYSELDGAERLAPELTIRQYGRRCFIRNEPEPEDVEAAQAGLAEAEKALFSGDYELVILDEANIALHYELFTLERLFELIDGRPEHVELVITGRRAPDALIERADLVTEMREIKHYYTQGVEARKGIES